MDLENQAAAKVAVAAEKLVKVQAAKALRLAKRVKVAEARQRQLAVLGEREQIIKVSNCIMVRAYVNARAHVKSGRCRRMESHCSPGKGADVVKCELWIWVKYFRSNN